jgi:hypothetical protein
MLLVTSGAAIASAYGGWAARSLLIWLAALAAYFAVDAAWTRLRSSSEALAAGAAGLAFAGVAPGDLSTGGHPLPAAVLAVVFLGLHLMAPSTATWPLAAWVAAQLAVLRGLDAVPPVLQTEVCLCVALVGLGIALFGRRLVARLALLTTAPWWLVGVVGGSSSAWADDGAERWLSAVLMIAAAFGLLVARLREELEPLLGPPPLVPVVAGVVAGAATTGAFSSLGFLAMTLTGYAGVLIANTAAATLDGWRRGLFLPVALAAGSVMAVLCIVQLLADARWSELCLLLVLTAVPTVLVAVRRPEDRPVALPVAVLCLAGAALLALPDELLSPAAAAVVLTALYGTAMAVGAELDRDSRRATARSAAVCAVAAAAVLVAEGQPAPLAVVLAVQGAFTLAWAWRTTGAQSADDATARRVGAGLTVLGFWIAAASAGFAAVEWYTLPAAAALLVASGPALWTGASWPAWGPGLLVAAVPSGVLAVIAPDSARAVGVLAAAALAMVFGARSGLRAPLMVGAYTALALAVGFMARALPWPLASALVVGSVLLAVGTLRERRPVAGFSRRVADLR